MQNHHTTNKAGSHPEPRALIRLAYWFVTYLAATCFDASTRVVCPLLVLVAMTSVLSAAPGNHLPLIRGKTYEGVIVMADKYDPSSRDEVWVPYASLIREAETALPAAIAATLKDPIRPNLSGCSPAKNATSLNLSAAPPDLVNFLTSDKDFLYSLHPLNQYKRQYRGETVAGVKVLDMHFIYGPAMITDPYLADWRHSVVEGKFWMVLYNPASKSFTNWEYLDLP